MENNHIKTNSFWTLFKNVSIQIPKIQRDYAQGRVDPKTQSIRNTFLNELLELIVENKTKELDFIYGTIESRNTYTQENIFIPLDGQQRLTTLFLLHWYFSTDRSVFKGCKNESRFTYETRVSSRLFCDELVNYIIDYSVTDLTDCIKDSPWYSQSWNYDPTIKAMLVMIEAIHRRCKQYSNEEKTLFWNRLTSDTPPITFQLLYLNDFSLTDELYIKMNARGKSLTEFENFKSFLDEEIDILYGQDNKFSESWKENIDGPWTDLFWKYRNRGDDNPYEIDDEYIRFFKGFLSTHLILNELQVNDRMKTDYVVSDFFKNLDNLNSAFINILDGNKEIPNYIYKKTNVLTSEVFETISTILNNFTIKDNEHTSFSIDFYWEILKDINFNISDKNFKEANNREVTLFDTFINDNPTYKERVIFYAFTLFIIKNGADLLIDTKIQEEFFQWMRIMRNLIENRQFNSFSDFRTSILSVKELIKADNILEYFTKQSNDIEGFNNQQIEEERIKAILLLRNNPVLTKKIRESEEHGYFLGQIDFLLSFSGVNINNAANYDLDDLIPLFDKYKIGCEAIFNSEGLNSNIPDFLFERALLSIGDYLFYKNSNWSFLVNNDRDISWKRMLNEQDKGNTKSIRRNSIKELINNDLFDINQLDKSLEDIIKVNLEKIDENDWRKSFIQDHRILEYCGPNKLVRWENEDIYLLKRERMSGAHAEYRTYALYLKYKDIEDSLHPFNVRIYTPSGREHLPCMFFELKKENENHTIIDVHYLRLLNSDEYRYQISVLKRKEDNEGLINKLDLESEGFFWDNNWNKHLYLCNDLSDLDAKLKIIREKIISIEVI